MTSSPSDLLEALLSASPRLTSEAPQDCRGLYGLVDHLGLLRYIGSTCSAEETFYKRIHQRHRTGSEDSSHYFSRMYNTGRMWRLRNDPVTKADGDLAKRLRNAFIAQHCRAVWVPLPDDANIAGLEREVLSIAPPEAIAWNRRSMAAYEEPEALVDALIEQIGFGPFERAAIERQRSRFLLARGASPVGASAASPRSASAVSAPGASPSRAALPPFPSGPFRFFALDVETANNRRSSICQVGVACVQPDNSIRTWVTYVDPKTSDWSCSRIHGITGRTVVGAPSFADVMTVLERALEGRVVYQHSSFDRGAINAACGEHGLVQPDWDWQDSVQVARRAWPALKQAGGHGLASLKRHLGLNFTHHDAGEDARAAAEVVLRAEARHPLPAVKDDEEEDFDLIEVVEGPQAVLAPKVQPPAEPLGARLLGLVELTQGNITNNHIYLRSFFSVFPAEVIGGSNMSQAAQREITVDWGGGSPVMTDLDGEKKFFRKRSWIRDFFQKNGARAGDRVAVEQVGPYGYRVRLHR